MPSIPSFGNLSAAFSVVNVDVDTVKKIVFGKDNKKTYITNACAIRLSRALNYGGDPISKQPQMAMEKGVDKFYYFLRVKDLYSYLSTRYGSPGTTIKPPAGKASGIDSSSLKGKRGIIQFKVDIWSDATGHFDLWNGEKCLGHSYFDQASSVSLWES